MNDKNQANNKLIIKSRYEEIHCLQCFENILSLHCMNKLMTHIHISFTKQNMFRCVCE